MSASAHSSLLAEYLTLDQADNQVQLEYVYIDARGGLRCKSRTLDFVPTSVEQIPVWNTDGCVTYYTDVFCEVDLVPVRLYRDPHRRGNNLLVLCQVMQTNGQPFKQTTRCSYAETMKQAAHLQPLFGIEQEYTLLDGQWPFGWPPGGYPPAQGPYHCGVGANVVFGRQVVEAHYRACLYAGIKISGVNSECFPSQWEYQIGPCDGASIGDDVWMSRFLLHRVAENFNIGVTLDPKLVPGWPGAGAHTNFSTNAMRILDGGLAQIELAIERLRKKHSEHMQFYDANNGQDNVRRLVGQLASSSVDKFTYGIGDRNASVRIPSSVAKLGGGYLEDRRPASNMDPYVVCELLVRTCCLDE